MARAKGKAILLGEHAVVYGVPALVVGLDQGVEASARRAAGPRSTLRIGDQPALDDAGEGELSRAFAALLSASGASEAVEVEATSALPPGSGLGSSAALAVAVARAVAEALGLGSTPEQEQERALAWERVFHGNPSGIDTAAAAAGGCLLYARGSEPERVRLREPLSLALGHAGYGASTRAMVESVARQRDRRPEVFARQLDAVRSLVGNGKLALEGGDLVSFGKLMDLNQMILAGWMLSTQELEELCRLARGAGALGAKLTGGGGGGCVVALCEGEPDDVLEAWRAAGFNAFAATVTP